MKNYDELISQSRQRLVLAVEMYTSLDEIEAEVDYLVSLVNEKWASAVERLNARVQELSWQGQVDHMSGAFDPNDRHEMGG